MWKMRLLGGAMFLYGAIMLILLYSPYKDWALDHSIAEVVSYSDRRVDNQVSGSVDEPLAIAGSAVVMFAGLWFLLFVPWVIDRHFGKMARQAGYDDEPTGPPPVVHPSGTAPEDPPAGPTPTDGSQAGPGG